MSSRKKFIQITNAPSAPGASEYIVGTKDNGLSGSQDYKYTKEQLAAGIAPSIASPVVCTADGAAITNAYFSNAIRFLVVGGQFKTLAGGDFSQAGTTITLLDGTTVATGNVVVAFI